MLDLTYNPVSKIYDAPFQLKANNGIYLIDDFGRQRATPAEVLNRWIVPMERKIDFLSFRSGGKMAVPFDAFLVFSTNLNPERLGDEAFLRRIQYKMLLRGPDEHEFEEIFRRFCLSKKLPCPSTLVSYLLDRHYMPSGKPRRRCHPRDILAHAIDIIHFDKLPYALNEELIDRAFESCFVQDEEAEDATYTPVVTMPRPMTAYA
jgi:predicted ATPase with chaperone activity